MDKMKSLKNIWHSVLNLGCNTTRISELERTRLMVLNALSMLMIFFISIFLIIFLAFNVSNWAQLLPAFPLYFTVLILNKMNRHKYALQVFFWGSLLLLTIWCFFNRRTGAEFGLIALTCTSIFISGEKFWKYFVSSVIVFSVYKTFDILQPFIPDPSYDYSFLPQLILYASAAVVIAEIITFHNLTIYFFKRGIRHNNLLGKTIKMRHAAERDAIEVSEKLKISNEELQTLAEQLDWIVKQKSTELKSYLDAIDVHIFSAVTDTSSMIVKINEPFLKEIGFRQQELLGKNFNVISSGYHASSFFREMYQTISSGSTWRGEVKNKRKDGTYFWIDMVILPLRSEKGEVDYYLTLALPITERKELEEKRNKTVELLEAVTFRTSHQVRGPLARILGLTSLLEMDMVKMSEVNNVSKMLVQSANELDASIHELAIFVNRHEQYFVNQIVKSTNETVVTNEVNNS